MWEDMESVAIKMGINLKTYWEEISPKQFKKYVDVYTEREKQKVTEIDMYSYNLGKYIGIAVNNPKKYPSNPFLKEAFDREELTNKRMTEEQMKMIAKKITYKFGGKVK